MKWVASFLGPWPFGGRNIYRFAGQFDGCNSVRGGWVRQTNLREVNGVDKWVVY